MSVVNPRQRLGLVREGTGQKRAHLMGKNQSEGREDRLLLAL